jgi:hypothetical protein
MEISDIYAKQVVIERLLVILLSDCRYADLISDIQKDVDDFEDDEATSLEDRALALSINEELRAVVAEISINHIHQVLK